MFKYALYVSPPVVPNQRGGKKAKNTTQANHKSPVNSTTYRSRPCEVNTLCCTLSHLIAKQANANTLKIFWCDLQIRKHNKRTRSYKTYTFYQTSLCVTEVFLKARNHIFKTHQCKSKVRTGTTVWFRNQENCKLSSLGNKSGLPELALSTFRI